MITRTRTAALTAAVLTVFLLAGCSSPGGSPTQNDAPTQEEVVDEPAVETPAAPELTMGQQNAVDKANSYLQFQAFSRTGLIQQLEFEGFPNADATFAVDNIGADWTAQAALKAQSYLDSMSFSREGLVEQLVFEGFTPEEAEAGVVAVGY